MEESVTTATTIMEEEEEPPFNTEKESEDNIDVEAMGYEEIKTKFEVIEWSMWVVVIEFIREKENEVLMCFRTLIPSSE